jgi:hypothetical protein
MLVLWVSNSSSRGHWELDEAPAVRNPLHMAEIGRRDGVSIGERQCRIAFQGRVAACRAASTDILDFPARVLVTEADHDSLLLSIDRLT